MEPSLHAALAHRQEARLPAGQAWLLRSVRRKALQIVLPMLERNAARTACPPATSATCPTCSACLPNPRCLLAPFSVQALGLRALWRVHSPSDRHEPLELLTNDLPQVRMGWDTCW